MSFVMERRHLGGKRAGWKPALHNQQASAPLLIAPRALLGAAQSRHGIFFFRFCGGCGCWFWCGRTRRRTLPSRSNTARWWWRRGHLSRRFLLSPVFCLLSSLPHGALLGFEQRADFFIARRRGPAIFFCVIFSERANGRAGCGVRFRPTSNGARPRPTEKAARPA